MSSLQLSICHVTEPEALGLPPSSSSSSLTHPAVPGFGEIPIGENHVRNHQFSRSFFASHKKTYLLYYPFSICSALQKTLHKWNPLLCRGRHIYSQLHCVFEYNLGNVNWIFTCTAYTTEIIKYVRKAWGSRYY